MKLTLSGRRVARGPVGRLAAAAQLLAGVRAAVPEPSLKVSVKAMSVVAPTALQG